MPLSLLKENWIRCTIGGFCIHLVLGTLYLWGIITVAITSYLRKYDPTVTYDDTVMIYATALGMQGATYILGGITTKYIGAQRTCLFGGYALVLGVFLSSMVTSLKGLTFTYGVMFGIGLGFSYVSPIGCASSWNPSRKGLITGVIVAGFGGGAFIFQFISSAVLHQGVTDESSERNKLVNGYYSPESDIVKNVPQMFFVLSICYFVMITLGCFLLVENNHIHSDSEVSKQSIPVAAESSRYSGSGSISRKYATIASSSGMNDSDVANTYQLTAADCAETAVALRDDSDIADMHANKENEHENGVSLNLNVGPLEMIKIPLAWHLASCFITTTIGGMYLLGTYKVYGQTVLGGGSEAFLSQVGGVASLLNAAGRIAWGELGDLLGPIETIIFLSLFFSILIFTYPMSPQLGEEFGFTLWTFLIFVFEGGNFALYMPVTIQLFGISNSSANFGVVATVYALSNVVNIYYLSRAKVSFAMAAHLMGALTFIGFINICLLYCHVTQYRKRQSENIDSRVFSSVNNVLIRGLSPDRGQHKTS